MGTFRKHQTKDGGTVYLWRGKVPIKQDDGSVIYRRVERSTKSGTLAGAREAARRIEAEYHDCAGRPLEEVSEVTFAAAAILYMKSGGERRFLDPILQQIGTLPAAAINQDVVQAVADKILPDGKSSTVNRQVFTPILSVLNYAAGLKKCPPPLLRRPTGHDKTTRLELPADAWWTAVVPHMPPKLRALVLLLTMHGLRIGEAIERVPNDIDASWRLSIPDTKTGEPVLVPLSQPVIEAIKDVPGWRQQKWLFGTCHRSNIARAIRVACKKAGMPAYGSHAIGRHSFATRILRDGKKSVKFLMVAGRWKSEKMPMMRYGHLERSEVNEEVNELAVLWAAKPNEVKRRKKA